MLRFDDLQQNSQQLDTKMGAYTLQRYGQQIAWVPNRAKLIGKGQHTQLAKKAEAIDKLYQVFAGQRCNLPQRARNMLAACNLLAYGCGDEAKSILQLGTCKALLLVMELDDISNEAISKAMPKRDTVARDEHYLAAMARAVRRQEMRDDNVVSLGGESDHGKRKGLDHLVFPVKWIARGKFGLKKKMVQMRHAQMNLLRLSQLTMMHLRSHSSRAKRPLLSPNFSSSEASVISSRRTTLPL